MSKTEEEKYKKEIKKVEEALQGLAEAGAPFVFAYGISGTSNILVLDNIREHVLPDGLPLSEYFAAVISGVGKKAREADPEGEGEEEPNVVEFDPGKADGS